MILKNINFSYTPKVPILENFSLHVKEKSFLGIFAVSGKGKTTLLKIIGGILKPNSGDVLFNRKNIYKTKKAELLKYRWQKIWFSFQEYHLLEDFSVKQNIQMPYIIGKNKIDEKWKEYLLEYLEIKELYNKPINKLSGGQKERVSLARSLIHKPEILLTDEPGNSLDKDLRIKVYKLLKDYSKEHLVIAVSHDEDLKNYIDAECYLK